MFIIQRKMYGLGMLRAGVAGSKKYAQIFSQRGEETSVEMHTFSKNLGTTLKFYALEGQNGSRSLLRIHKY
jgi:hypothetical protein